MGDRAQSRRPFAESWEQRLNAVGIPRSRVLRLTVSYRTPAVLMAPAAAVIRAARPDALVPDAVRTDGRPLEVARVAGDLLTAAVERAHALRGDGTAVVVAHPDRSRPVAANGVALLAPEELQGLEMDVVVLVEPAELLPDDGAAAALYVALTRATQAVVVLHQRDLPKVAQPLLHAPW